jgi:hypothetical protein
MNGNQFTDYFCNCCQKSDGQLNAGGSHLKSYLLGRQGSGGSQFKASSANSFQDLISNIPNTQKGWWSVRALANMSSIPSSINKPSPSETIKQRCRHRLNSRCKLL